MSGDWLQVNLGTFVITKYIDGLVQESHNTSVLAISPKPSIYVTPNLLNCMIEDNKLVAYSNIEYYKMCV